MSDESRNQSFQHHAAGLTPGEQRVAQGLDTLGDAARREPDAGFEDRLFRASLEHLPAPSSLNHPGVFGSGRLFSPARLALAACVAIAGGAVWTATQSWNPAPGGTPTDQVALAELEAEVGFTLDALLASYDVEISGLGTDDASADGSFWDSEDDEWFAALDTEIAL